MHLARSTLLDVKTESFHSPSVELLRQVSFSVLAGVESARLDGEAVVCQLANFDQMRELRASEPIPLIMKFANWSQEPAGILNFAHQYGPLREPSGSQEEARFTLGEWRQSQDWFRRHWGRPSSSGWDRTFIGRLSDSSSYAWTYRNRRLEYKAGSLQEFLWLTFYSLPPERLRKCSGPHCQTPYFIAEHLNQKCCSDGCKREAQKQSKLSWWRAHGPDWRQERRRKSRRRGSSRRGNR